MGDEKVCLFITYCLSYTSAFFFVIMVVVKHVLNIFYYQGEMEVTPAAYGHLTSSLMGLADGKVAVVLEVCCNTNFLHQ